MGVPALQELCFQVVRENIRGFEVARKGVTLIHLADDILTHLLDFLGGTVTAKLLRKMEEDSGKDRNLLKVMDPSWERLCRAKFRQDILLLLKQEEEEDEEEAKAKSKSKSKKSKKTLKRTWRRRYRQLEEERAEKLARTERMAERHKNTETNKRRNVKIINGPIPRLGASGNVKYGYGPGSSSSSRQTVFKTSTFSSSTGSSSARAASKLDKIKRAAAKRRSKIMK